MVIISFQKPIGILTTTAGKPVDIRETTSINSELLTNQFFIETIKHLVNERIPDREVVAKGTGAYGYFEVTNDVTKYTKAKVFSKIGKKTPVFARLAISQIDQGGSDTVPIAIRGFSLKMYTEEGNLDFLNIQIPVYIYKDPVLFESATHAFRRSPKTNIQDFSQVIDFVTLNPTSIHAFLWVSSELGLPRGYRRMNGFPIHAYEIYNEHGESFFVKFKFLAEKGYESLTLEEAAAIGGTDPDFFERDLYNAIKKKNYPSWRVEMDVMTAKQIKEVDFDPFDVTKLWRNGTYHTVEIGRVVLDKNIENHFAEVEQAAFNPANLVPGILGPHDQVFKGRILAYADAHIHRLGVNFNKVEINCPRYAKTYQRDGLPPVRGNGRDSPIYFPNAFNGPLAYVDESKPNKRLLHYTTSAIDLEPASIFYNTVLKTEEQKNRLTDNLGQAMVRVPKESIEKFTNLLREVDKDLARRFLKSLERIKRTRPLPSMVEELKST